MRVKEYNKNFIDTSNLSEDRKERIDLLQWLIKNESTHKEVVQSYMNQYHRPPHVNKPEVMKMLEEDLRFVKGQRG